MAVRRRWIPVVLTVTLAGTVLGNVLVYGRIGEQRREERALNETKFTIDHVRRTTDRIIRGCDYGLCAAVGALRPERIPGTRSGWGR